jgi:hypothetical protein
MKKLVICSILLVIFVSGCQERNHDAIEELNEIKNIEAQVVSSMNIATPNVVEEVVAFGGGTFDPELQIQLNDDGFFDQNSDLSIIEEDDATFVVWTTKNGFLGTTGLHGSVATNENWEVTNKALFDNNDYLSWKLEGTHLLVLKDTGSWSQPQREVSIRQLTRDGTFSKEVVLASIPIVYNLDIIPSSHGKVVIYSSNSGGETKEITYNVIPIEDEFLENQTISIKYFPEGGIEKPSYIDFANNKLYGLGKKSTGLLQVSLDSGEPLYDESKNEKVAEVGELVHMSSNEVGEIEVFSNDSLYLHKHVFDKNLNVLSEEIIGSRNEHVTVHDNMLHYWEVITHDHQPTLHLTKIQR